MGAAERQSAREECRRLNKQVIELCALSKFTEALQIAQTSANLAVARLDPQGALIVSCHDLLYWIYLKLGHESESQAAAQTSERIRAEIAAQFAEKVRLYSTLKNGADLMPEKHRPLKCMQSVALAFIDSKHFSHAAPMLELVIAHAEALEDVDSDYLANGIAWLAHCKWHLKELEAAEALCDKAINQWKAAGIAFNRVWPGHLELFEEVYLQSGRSSDSQYFSKIKYQFYYEMGF